ncbi:hypothetical protein CSKR_201080 [Clonorchis sinensis]|uniref:Uncharacterized protein n=1 Tax=Clonorchis sinensis TaxID=79923 RepID=A0A8T1MLA7_CLOSI|nr:hypothetical protein CSKR_201080 [Clonorchis sinensis]
MTPLWSNLGAKVVPKFMRFARPPNPLGLKYLARPPLVRRVLELPNPVSRMSRRNPHPRAGTAGLGTSSDCAPTNKTRVDSARPWVRKTDTVGHPHPLVFEPGLGCCSTTQATTDFDRMLPNFFAPRDQFRTPPCHRSMQNSSVSSSRASCPQ